MTHDSPRHSIVTSAQTIVVKLGTHVLTDESGRLNARLITSLCRQVAELRGAGRRIVVVSSGAIGAGIGALGLSSRPTALPMLQAAAAIGQGQLMQLFERGLKHDGLHASQILLTRSDFEDRRRYLNIRHTIDALHKLNAVPIINENDTVAVDEIRFGDNDLIAALTANLIRADLLVIFTVVDGLIRDGRVLETVEHIDDDVLALAGAGKTALGLGGMRSKLQTILLATQAGRHVLLANGRKRNILHRLIVNADPVGTFFPARARRIAGRRVWIALAARPAGKLIVDPGAARAVIRGGKSLLPSGLTAVVGSFPRGAVVSVVDPNDAEVARGQVNYSADEIDRIKGRRSTDIAKILGRKHADEVIHRNYLIVTAG